MVHSKLFKTCNGRDIFIIMKYNCLNEVVAYESTTMTNRSRVGTASTCGDDEPRGTRVM